MSLEWGIHPGEMLPQSAAALAELSKACHAQVPIVVVGERGHVTVDDIYPGLPDFLNEMGENGATTHTVELDLSLEQLAANTDYIKLMRSCEIKNVVLPALTKKGYFVRSRLTKAREALDRLAPALDGNEVKLILPVHGSSLLPSPSAAFHLVRGLPPYAFGIALDPGGLLFEGFEAWDYTVAILMDYLSSVTVRDYTLRHAPGHESANNKSWLREWAMVQDGMTDWADMAYHLRKIEFSGTLVLRPMVSRTEVEIKNELGYLHSMFQAH